MSSSYNQAATLASSDKRRFFRIEDYVALKIRHVSDADLARFADGNENSSVSRQSLAGTFSVSNRQMDYVLRRIKEDDPDIATYLGALNEKLDLLARTLSQEEHDLTDEPVRKVDLSAAGISLPVETHMRAGTPVEIRMLFFPSLIQVVAMADIVRCETVTDPETGFKFRVAADFKHLKDDARELLVQHITQKESSLLRERRIDSGNL